MKHLLFSSILTLTLNTSPLPAETLEERILVSAKTSQTVMFGEDHNVHYDDHYVAKILPKLKKLGYMYFAMELDGKNKDAPNYYKNILTMPSEQSLTQLMKKAEAVGMNVMCYDDSRDILSLSDLMNKDIMSRRERKAFANLGKMIFTRDLKAKVVFFCGFSHIAEQPSGRAVTPNIYKIRWLGWFLEKYTHGKNLSVNLSTHVIPSTDIAASEKEYLDEIRNAE